MEQVRQFSSELRDETEIREGMGVILHRKVLYHGSPTAGIKQFTIAEEDTVGSGVYFTSNPEDAAGYAKRRSKAVDDSNQIVYKVEVNGLKLVDLRDNENVRKIMAGFRERLLKMLKNTNLDYFYQKAVENSIQAIDKGLVQAGTIRAATFNHTKVFTCYLQSLGFDGLVTFEGGEGYDVGPHDSYVIFDPTKVKIVQETQV